MRRPALLLVILFLAAACGQETPKPLSEPGEKLYVLRGVVESRNPDDNTIRVNHEAVAGFMTAMTMDFSVRGADVGSLPADGKRVEAKLHVTDLAVWITDVKQVP